MRKLLVAASILFLCSYCMAQSVDAVVEGRLKRMILRDNQYFNSSSDDFLVLFNVIPDSSLLKKDSLQTDSRRLYEDIITAIGRDKEGLSIDIAYIGKCSDKNDISFSYANYKYKGIASYGDRKYRDTLLASNEGIRNRLADLPKDIYVRHTIGKYGLTIAFSVITQEDVFNMAKKRGEVKAARLLNQYVKEQYCQYTGLVIYYIDQYTGATSRYTVNVSDLILDVLNEYYYDHKLN